MTKRIKIDRNLHVIRKQKEHMDLNYDYGPFDEEDALEALEQECGMTRDGTCMLAGSEYCDWDCPFSS